MTRALPLRILLILALMLDGIGGAVAGVLASIPAGPAAMSAAMSATQWGADNVVADHGASDQRLADHHGADPQGSAVSAVTHGGPDHATVPQPPVRTALSGAANDHGCGDDPCDRSAECRQACMHAAAAVPAALALDAPPSHASLVLHPLATGHPSPSLPSPIRPPIA